jgi:hypothetical protein
MGGARLLSSPSSALLREESAFDTKVNGKEASAYLRHVVRRYDSFADVTIFAHTQPSLHVHNRAFKNLLDRFLRAPVSSVTPHSLGVAPLPVPALVGVAAYESINYRYFSGAWAHDPPPCVMSLLHFCFSDGAGDESMGDKGRRPPAKRDHKEFLATKMGAWAAGQFAAPRWAIRQRSREWWARLLAVNVGDDDGSRPLKGCHHRDQERGTMVASAMERLWHNFFINATTDRQPLCLRCPQTDDRCLGGDVSACS